MALYAIHKNKFLQNFQIYSIRSTKVEYRNYNIFPMFMRGLTQLEQFNVQ